MAVWNASKNSRLVRTMAAAGPSPSQFLTAGVRYRVMSDAVDHWH